MNILFILFLTFAKTDGSPSAASSAAQLPAMINRCGYQSGSAEMLHSARQQPRGFPVFAAAGKERFLISLLSGAPFSKMKKTKNHSVHP